MFFVYLLSSINYPDQIYIGFTADLEKRLLAHNSGESPHTSKYKPWKLIMYFGFPLKAEAYNFEKCLKTQSGRAFIAKRLYTK